MSGAAAIDFDPTSYLSLDDPYPTLRALRTGAPAHYNRDLDCWTLSRYADVLAAVKDWERYSSGHGIALDVGPAPMIISMDPPRQTQLRGLLGRAFAPRRVAALEVPVRRLARELTDDFLAAGTFDIITEFSDLLPMAVITWMLGSPAEDRALLRRLVNDTLEQPPGTTERPATAARAHDELVSYCSDLVAARRRDPGDDLVSKLIVAGARIDVTTRELVGFCHLLLIAGYETTTKLIGNAVHLLARHPGQRAELRADPGLIPNAVEEVLRFDTPTPHMARRLTADTTLHGCTMRAGQQVLLLFGSANRDERRWSDPDRFDIHRSTDGHLAFGHGTHFCLGAAVARLETRIALEELLPRLGDYDIEPTGAVRASTRNNRGFLHLPLRALAEAATH